MDEMWGMHEVESALSGERLIKAVEESIATTKKLELMAEIIMKGVNSVGTPATNESVSGRFWDNWYHADELERLKLICRLTGMEDHATAVLVNSYLTDLTEYLEKTFKVQKGDEHNGL